MRWRVYVVVSRLMFIAFSTIIFTGASCGGPSVTTDSVVGTTPGVVPTTEQSLIVTLINQERGKRGLPSVTIDATIQAVATQYSADLVPSNLATYNFAINGTDGQTRLRNAGYGFHSFGQLGAIDFTTAQSLLNALIADNSFVLTDSSFNHIGVGVANSAAHNYWTLILTD